MRFRLFNHAGEGDGCDDTDDEDSQSQISGMATNSTKSRQRITSKAKSSHLDCETGDKDGSREIDTEVKFILQVQLISGTSLAVRDRSGTSDPYVKFKIGKDTVYKSNCQEKCLNPIWNEEFSISLDKIEDVTVRIKVYDSNWGIMADFMGLTCLELNSCAQNEWEEKVLALSPRTPDEADDEELGFLRLRVQLLPQIDNTSLLSQNNAGATNEEDPKLSADTDADDEEDAENGADNDDDDHDDHDHDDHDDHDDDVSANSDLNLIVPSSSSSSSPSKLRLRKPVQRRETKNTAVNRSSSSASDTSATAIAAPAASSSSSSTLASIANDQKPVLRSPGLVTVVLREGVDLPAMDINGLSDPYVKVRLGSEKRRTKVKSSTLNPHWFQTFEFQADDLLQLPQLRFDVYDRNWGARDDFIGHAFVNLSTLQLEKTHHMPLRLEIEGGVLKVSVTLTGFSAVDLLTDDHSHEVGISKEAEECFHVMKTFQRPQEVGRLNIKIVKAEGLRPADFNGSSDPFVVVKLVNSRLKTKTVHKSVDPEWNKVFHVPVKDMSSTLEIHVLDENRNRAPDFLGRVDIPLLEISRAQSLWLHLKDEKLRSFVKGRIYLEMELVYNPIRAALRLMSPREKMHKKQTTTKPNLKLLWRNYDRILTIKERAFSCFYLFRDIVNWEYPLASLVALLFFVVGVWIFEFFFLPLGVALALVSAPLVEFLGRKRSEEEEKSVSTFDDDDDGNKRSFAEDSQLMMDFSMQMNVLLDTAATTCERLRNLFSWRTPFLSLVMLILVFTATVLALFIPPKIIIILIGLHYMTKKFRGIPPLRQHVLYEFLKRVPSDEENAATSTRQRQGNQI